MIYQTVAEHGWEFYFPPIKYAIPIPIRTIPISSRKTTPIPMGIGIPTHTSNKHYKFVGTENHSVVESTLKRCIWLHYVNRHTAGHPRSEKSVKVVWTSGQSIE